MQAIELDVVTKTLKLVKKELPTISDNEVLVQVHFAGICGTDLHIIDGEFPCKKSGSLVLGHEFSGIVVKVGKNVTNVEIGDKVVADPNKGCMICSNCRNGNPHFCKTGGLQSTIGIFVDGGWQQYCAVPDCQTHKIPQKISLEQASLCEPISCIAHAWDRISPIPIGSKILILGTGIIGNLFTSLIHLQGYKNVTISEPNEKRLRMAEKLETGFTLITPNTLTALQRNDKNYLFDVIIDSSGNAKAIEHAFSLLDYGGKLCMFGVANPTAKVCIPPYEIFKKEITIYGVLINPFTFPKALSYLESMGDRYVEFDKLGVKVFPLEDYRKAIESLRQGSVAKATFKIEHKN